MELEVKDHPAAGRYEIRADGKLAGFVQYRLNGNRITMFHTEVDEAFEGHGVGSTLAREALASVRARGLDLIPTCPFIAGYIARHPDEYLDLVAPAYRDRVNRAAS